MILDIASILFNLDCKFFVISIYCFFLMYFIYLCEDLLFFFCYSFGMLSRLEFKASQLVL